MGGLKSLRRLHAVIVAIPFLALLIWTVSVGITHGTGDTWRVKIVGYDPIDLLSGHYLNFRYDLAYKPICENRRGPTCACLEPSHKQTLIATSSMDCMNIESICPRYVRGSCSQGLFLTGSERFYFPENYAPVLAVVPPESYAEIKLSPTGFFSLQNIFVGSQTILDYAKMRLEERTP